MARMDQLLALHVHDHDRHLDRVEVDAYGVGGRRVDAKRRPRLAAGRGQRTALDDDALFDQAADYYRYCLSGEASLLGDLDAADPVGGLDRAEHDVDVVRAHSWQVGTTEHD